MRDFHHLDAWHKAHNFTLQVFKTTEAFPKVETYGLTATLRRGVTVLTMKIAEACGYDTTQEYTQGLARARGIGLEVEYALLLARDLELMSVETHDSLRSQLIEVRRMLSGLIKSGSA